MRTKKRAIKCKRGGSPGTLTQLVSSQVGTHIGTRGGLRKNTRKIKRRKIRGGDKCDYITNEERRAEEGCPT
jgi:hypothetical protein